MTHRLACTAAASILLAAAPHQTFAEVPDPPAEAEIRGAIDRGVGWLVAAQQSDGSWGSGGFRGSVAVTANGLLALLAAGNTPASGPHAEASAKGVAFLVDAFDDGLFASREPGSRGPMYGQAYAILVLAELLGETDAPGLREQLARAGELLEDTQNDEGGWRYQPRRGDADISVTSAVVVALASLEKSGIPVSERCMERALAYIRRLQNDDGGFRYQTTTGPSAAPRTAAAVLALLVAAEPSREEGRDAIERGADWLGRNRVSLAAGNAYALYGLAATANACWQIGEPRWAEFFGPAGRDLLDTQGADGSWSDPSCHEYGTAAAVITLAAPDGLTPLFQP